MDTLNCILVHFCSASFPILNSNSFPLFFFFPLPPLIFIWSTAVTCVFYCPRKILYVGGFGSEEEEEAQASIAGEPGDEQPRAPRATTQKTMPRCDVGLPRLARPSFLLVAALALILCLGLPEAARAGATTEETGERTGRNILQAGRSREREIAWFRLAGRIEIGGVALLPFSTTLSDSLSVVLSLSPSQIRIVGSGPRCSPSTRPRRRR